jgi:hypothetical protein
MSPTSFLTRLLPLLALGAAVASAQVTLRFSGTANLVLSPLTDTFTVGNPITLTVSYNPAAAGNYSGEFSRTFDATSAVLSVTRNGGVVWTTDFLSPTIQVEDTGSFDRITFTAGAGNYSDASENGRTLTNASLSLYAAAPGPLATFTALPTDIVRSQWSTLPSQSGLYTYWDLSGTLVRFGVSTVENLSAIPEPSTTAALIGTVALAGAAWRRSRVRT